MQQLPEKVEMAVKLVKAACILHNIALMNENEAVSIILDVFLK